VPQKIVAKATSPQTTATLMSQRIGRVVSLRFAEYIPLMNAPSRFTI
jgi:hypothetical protein